MSIRYGRLKTKSNQKRDRPKFRPLAFVGEAMKRIYVVGTADTKGEELAYLAERVRAAGGDPFVVDVGIRTPAIPVDVSARDVASHHPAGAEAILSATDRGTAVAAMGEAFARFIPARNDVAAVVGVGGGGGTSIVTAGMRVLPIGLPKLMISTLASGDVRPYVDVNDIAMMYSVTDVAGLNSISRVVLANAAYAVAGMARATVPEAATKPAIGLTMFGVTTPAVTQVVETLRQKYDCLVFHATGTGGRAMEKLVDSGLLVGVIDVTTTEICDLLFDGVLSAGPDRLGAIARAKIPYVGSVGALDMVNFGGIDTVPERFRGRRLYRHNQTVTLMRTTAEECATIGRRIAEQLNRATGPVTLVLPLRGVSAIDAEGQAFHDPDADRALFAALREHAAPPVRIVEVDAHINDAVFAEALTSHMLTLLGIDSGRGHAVHRA
jgi:uncharacterized protein (UPF0261 family)